ncbi:MAG: hypothetical protein CO139_03580 [Candidatus Moranbacteria bacterium CG_4_9_14_3_um_filter_36_9]|nr:MAG: hypothetical protein CO139_03580 [Candidatus Moranbacteria bacterium CG_4_9_14_3_um_filter_36_9]
MRTNRFSKIFLSLIFCLFFVLPFLSLAASEAPDLTKDSFQYTQMESLPGFADTSDFYVYISNLYKLGIWAVGISAMLMIVIGGYMYATSAGNNASMEKAKEVITDALIGLILAMTSYVLLYIINPDLVRIQRLKTPLPEPKTQQEENPEAGAETPLKTTANGCLDNPAISCIDCFDCGKVDTSNVPCKENPCLLNKVLLTKIEDVPAGNWQITEPWPPTVKHLSPCHQNGTCADINLTLADEKGVPKHVKKLYDQLKKAGLYVVFESANCAPYTNLGVNCKYYKTMTSPSFHVE